MYSCGPFECEKQTATAPPDSIKWLAFLLNTQCVYCDVGTEFLRTVRLIWGFKGLSTINNAAITHITTVHANAHSFNDNYSMAFPWIAFQLDHPLPFLYPPSTIVLLSHGFRLRGFPFDYSNNILFPCVCWTNLHKENPVDINTDITENYITDTRAGHL